METLANRLKNARKKSELSLVQAAKIAGVSDKTWAKWEEGESSPDVDSLEKFANATGERLFALLTGAETFEIGDEREVPIVDRIPAGPLIQGFGEIKNLGAIRTSLKDPDAFALIVSGISMTPEIQEEDVVICSPRIPFVNGKIYAIVVGEGEQSLKRVRYDRRSQSYALIPSNKEFPTLHVPEQQVLRLVRVVEVRRDLQ